MNPEPIQFSPRSHALLQRFAQAPAALRQRLAGAMDYENQLTISHIQVRYLSFSKDFIGPVDGLRVRTSRLRSSLWAAKARVAGGMLLSSLGTNVVYAGVHEYGFNGPVQVRAFTRRNRALDVFRVSRVREFDLGTGRTRTKTTRARIAQGISRVRAHTRHAHYAERAPIRRGIADRLPAYTAALETAALAYLAGGTS